LSAWQVRCPAIVEIPASLAALAARPQQRLDWTRRDAEVRRRKTAATRTTVEVIVEVKAAFQGHPGYLLGVMSGPNKDRSSRSATITSRCREVRRGDSESPSDCARVKPSCEGKRSSVGHL